MLGMLQDNRTAHRRRSFSHSPPSVKAAVIRSLSRRVQPL